MVDPFQSASTPAPTYIGIAIATAVPSSVMSVVASASTVGPVK